MAAVSQEYPPLLFTLPSEQPVEFRTPRSIHSPLRDASGSISTARRSVTPPGSVHTDTTPPRPPPIMRLQDTLMSDVDGPGAGTPPAGGNGPLAAAAQQPGSNLMQVEPVTQSEDTWVTVFGFSPDDLALVLQEFQRCGDILQWGTFGAPLHSNFMHVQYQTKYGAQRALLRSGEQLSSTLIIGVKQLEPQHRALVEAYGSGANSSPGPRLRAPQQGPLRPYRVDVSGAQALPQRSRTLVQKLSEFVLGI
ncbi:hypothetical protein OEZ86_006384 [Tetradesmus obliquus]|nr:hypothetical protein OEZ86_006384 [Tetradesmus obliquus]